LPTERAILCLNSGSSSLKFALYRMGEGEALMLEGAVEHIGLEGGRFWARRAAGEVVLEEQRDFRGTREAVEVVFQKDGRRVADPDAVGHRVVHGGPDHVKPERVTPKLLESLERLISFAPLHLPSEIQVMRFIDQVRPDVPQVACFDTAFHRAMPEVAQRFSIPRRFWQQGVRRYGFHGLSYEYIVGTLGAEADGRLIIAHLGNGASLAAVRGRRPLDTTMGLTPCGGLMMGTRSGDLDPGVLLFLLGNEKYTPDQLGHLVNEDSGLLGVSAVTSDMKRLTEEAARDAQARQAVEMFCYTARKHLAAMTAVLDGLDVLVFTGGIGEHSAPVRRQICSGLGYLGIELDEGRNDDHAPVISKEGSRCRVRVIATNEDLMIARHARDVVFGPE
jgi:acetate kinase